MGITHAHVRWNELGCVVEHMTMEELSAEQVRIVHVESGLQDHEQRIRALERAYLKIAGAAGFAAAIGAFISRFIP